MCLDLDLGVASYSLICNAGLLPAFQKQGLAKEFIPKFLSYLKDIGYERVTSQHKGHNVAVLICISSVLWKILGCLRHFCVSP